MNSTPEVAAEEHLLGGGLDWGEDDGQEGEGHEGRQVRSQRESRRIQEEPDQSPQYGQHEPHAEARSYPSPVGMSPAGNEREGAQPVKKRNGEHGSEQEHGVGDDDDQVAGDRPRRGRVRGDLLRGDAEQVGEGEACPAPHDEPHKHDEDDPQHLAPPGVLAPPAGFQVGFVHAACPFRSPSHRMPAAPLATAPLLTGAPRRVRWPQRTSSYGPVLGRLFPPSNRSQTNGSRYGNFTTDVSRNGLVPRKSRLKYT